MNIKYPKMFLSLFFLFLFASVVFAATPVIKPGKVFTGDKHVTLQGLTCVDCHGDEKGEGEITRDKCLECHVEADIIESGKKQMDKLGRNPHDGHYIDLPCTECHQGHTSDVYFCGQCHPTGEVVAKDNATKK